ncbi:MAG: hypothetical protein GY751_25355 [Bacteroidetes bacterium]|nr:hypothetical protein [Bacteroidota bacterium]
MAKDQAALSKQKKKAYRDFCKDNGLTEPGEARPAIAGNALQKSVPRKE